MRIKEYYNFELIYLINKSFIYAQDILQHFHALGHLMAISPL